MVSFFPDETQREAAELGFLFEFCENGNVYDNLFKKRTLSKLNLRLHIGCQIAEGMNYLHEESIIHRDLNSMNVVLTKDFAAKICDFGCARRIGAQGHINPTTISGSPSYMSPEQLTGASQLTLKSDVWAMGVVLWELLTMQSPWVSALSDVNDHTALTQLIVKQRRRLPPVPETAVPDTVHHHVLKLLDKSFNEDPALRPSMKDFWFILQGIYNKLYPPPPPPPPPPPTPPPPPVAVTAIPGLQVLEVGGDSPTLSADGGSAMPPLRRGASFNGSASGEQDESHRKRAHGSALGPAAPAASAQPAAALDLAEGAGGPAESRGICPVCGTPVTTAHRGRMRNSMGTYFHAQCWETAADVHADAEAPPPPHGAGAADGPAPRGGASGALRGVCPMCRGDVTTAHEGRRLDVRGQYYHAQCWEAYEASTAPGAYGGAGGSELDFGGEVRLM